MADQQRAKVLRGQFDAMKKRVRTYALVPVDCHKSKYVVRKADIYKMKYDDDAEYTMIDMCDYIDTIGVFTIDLTKEQFDKHRKYQSKDGEDFVLKRYPVKIDVKQMGQSIRRSHVFKYNMKTIETDSADGKVLEEIYDSEGVSRMVSDYGWYKDETIYFVYSKRYHIIDLKQ